MSAYSGGAWHYFILTKQYVINFESIQKMGGSGRIRISGCRPLA